MDKESSDKVNLESMSAEEIKGSYVIVSRDGEKREFTEKEADQFYDMIHKTERAKKTFTMNDVEYASAQKFAGEHAGCMSKSALSEKFEYVFVPGGIGTAVCIKCLICGKEENITDFDCW